jgi:threonine synthase
VEDVKVTPSPAMDILVSSNFERFMYYVLLGDSTTACISPRQDAATTASTLLTEYIGQLKTSGGFTVDRDVLERARTVFLSRRTSNEETLDCIARYYNSKDHYLLDPHTAVGVHAAEEILKKGSNADYSICLATASPGKFPEHVLSAINRGVKGKHVSFKDIASPVLLGLAALPKRCWSVVTGGIKSRGVSQIRQIIECTCQLNKLKCKLYS